MFYIKDITLFPIVFGTIVSLNMMFILLLITNCTIYFITKQILLQNGQNTTVKPKFALIRRCFISSIPTKLNFKWPCRFCVMNSQNLQHATYNIIMSI